MTNKVVSENITCYPVTKEFNKQLKDIRKQTLNADHAINVLQNRRYWSTYNLLIGVNQYLFKKFYNKQVKLDVVNKNI